jgi:hypothetical protein
MAGDRGIDLGDVGGLRRPSVVDIPAILTQQGLYSVRPPEVRPGPGRIEWRWGDFEVGAPASDCLFNFLRLTDTDDLNEFVRYAAVHGVLGLTKKGLPGTYDASDAPAVSNDPAWRFESLNTWKAYAQNAKMILILTAALRRGAIIDPIAVLQEAGFTRESLRTEVELGSDTTRSYPLSKRANRILRELLPSFPSFSIGEGTAFFGDVPGLTNISLINSAKDVETQRQALMIWLEHHWLALANIAPIVEWSIGPPRLVLKLSHRSPPAKFENRSRFTLWPANTLFSVLAAELTGTICSDRYVAQCSHCLALHPSLIKVRTDQPHYCQSCRAEVRKKTNRTAQRKRYARQKAERTAN